MNTSHYLQFFKKSLSEIRWMLWLVLLVASWSIFIQDSLINRDGLLYLKQAYLFSIDSYKDAFMIFPYPFYSFLIGVIHKYIGVSLQLIAHSLNLIFFLFATLYYFKILQLLSKHKDVVFYGGLALLSFTPIMDDYVGMVIRDHGFWAGMIGGTYYFLRYKNEVRFKFFILWHSFFLLAALFRPEAIAFLALAPILAMVTKYNRATFLKNYLFLIIPLIGFGVVLQLINPVNFQYEYFLAIKNKIINIFNVLITPIPIETENFWLTKLLKDYSLVLTYSGFAGILIYKWVVGLGLLHGSIFFYSLVSKVKLLKDYKREIICFSGLGLILVFLNLLTEYVISGRYLVLHYWFLLLIISLALREVFYLKTLSVIYKLMLASIILVMIGSSLIDSNKLDIEKEAAMFVKNNHHNDRIYSIGADRVLFYAGISMEKIILSDNKVLEHGDLVIVQDHEKFKRNHSKIKTQLIQNFQMNNKEIQILQIIQPS